MAERTGFEPAKVLPLHAFQACALNRSTISPKRFILLNGRFSPSSQTIIYHPRKKSKDFSPQFFFFYFCLSLDNAFIPLYTEKNVF